MTTTVLHVDTDTGEVTNTDGSHVGNTHDGGELFDPAPYQAPVPTLDGHRADTLKLAFTGNVEVDAKINDDLEHFKSLRFGQEIVLRIAGVVGKNGWQIKIDPDSGDEKVTHTVGIVVHSYDTSA